MSEPSEAFQRIKAQLVELLAEANKLDEHTQRGIREYVKARRPSMRDKGQA